MKRIAVLLSNKGTGSNLAAILDAIDNGIITNGQVVVVVSDKPDAYGLVRATKHGIPTRVLNLKEFLSLGKARVEYDEALAKILKKQYAIDLVVLAGWMLILSDAFLNYFPNQVINLHPGLLPELGEEIIQLSTGETIPAIRGLHTDAAVQYAIDNHFPATGSSVHFVTPVVDDGLVIIRGEVPIRPGDTVETLYPRIKAVEHKILPKAIEMICSHRHPNLSRKTQQQ